MGVIGCMGCIDGVNVLKASRTVALWISAAITCLASVLRGGI